MMILSIFWLFSGSEGPPRTTEGPQLLPTDSQMCFEKSRLNILLRDDFTMGKKKVDKRISDDLRHVWPFKGSGGPPSTPEGPQRFSMHNLVWHEKAR